MRTLISRSSIDRGIDRVQTRTQYSQERESDCDLTVVFADLNTRQPEEAGPINVLNLMLWPQQICDAANILVSSYTAR